MTAQETTKTSLPIVRPRLTFRKIKFPFTNDVYSNSLSYKFYTFVVYNIYYLGLFIVASKGLPQLYCKPIFESLFPCNNFVRFFKRPLVIV